MSLTLLGFTLCMLMPCWSACAGWGLLCLLLLLPWSLDPCSFQRFLPCKGFSEQGELWKEESTWELPAGCGSDDVFVLESLGAFQTYCSFPPWPLSQIFAVGTKWDVCVNYSFFTVFTFWCFDSRDLLLLGVYPSQHWAIFRESVNKSTQSPPRTAAFIRLSYADLLFLCSDPSTEVGDEGRPSSRAWHHFVNQSALGLLASASSYPLQEA